LWGISLFYKLITLSNKKHLFPDKAKLSVRWGLKASGLVVKDSRAYEGWTCGEVRLSCLKNFI
jgi:hypothetical protein